MKIKNKSRNENIIALLTDFGMKDYFVGAMKGVILSINSEAKIIDLTHEIEPQNVSAASFTLRACYRDFPKGTIFVAVVDPGVGSNRRAILVEAEDFFFIAPDNGLLSFVLTDASSPVRVFKLTNEKFFHHPVSRTFHGRDIFAPVAAHLSNGVAPEVFGDEINDFVRFKISQPRKASESQTEAEIIHIDRFGNLITNLKIKDLPERFSLEINGRKIEKLQNFYAEAESNEIFMIFGSAGFLEIVVFHNSAAKLLSARNGQQISVKTL
jgi:S-adenosyl-L-methionine hydrolase (adenosine-forming)